MSLLSISKANVALSQQVLSHRTYYECLCFFMFTPNSLVKKPPDIWVNCFPQLLYPDNAKFMVKLFVATGTVAR